MEKVYANIEISNGDEIVFNRNGVFENSLLKSVRIKGVVDFNVKMLVLNQSIQKKLKFPIIEQRIFQMADGAFKQFDIAGNVIVKFENRQTCCNAIVSDSNEEVTLGMIPLNGLDVKIYDNKLIVNSEYPMINLPSIK